MDYNEAQLILASFRPNGVDSHDPVFAEALAFAGRDSELGNWLAKERAQDLAFAESLAEFPIPENLRENLYEALAQAHEAAGFDEFDRDFADLLKGIAPPAHLRNTIVAAMKVERKVTPLPSKRRSRSLFSLPAISFAAAAGVAAALIWSALTVSRDEYSALATLTPQAVQRQAVNFLTSDFVLDRRDSKQETLYQFLASNELPSPQILPVGLRDAAGVGCGRLEFQEKQASLICFQQKLGDPVIHLLIFRRGDVTGDLPVLNSAGKNCRGCHKSGWAMASWRDEDRAFFLLGQMSPEQLAAVF